jgi:competence protein ComEA
VPEPIKRSTTDWTSGPARQAAAIALAIAGAFALASSWASSRPIASSDPKPADVAVGQTSDRTFEPSRQPRVRATININTATQGELEALPGIGPSIAQRIIQQRESKGPFTSIEDLDKVRGIGPVTIERLRPYVSVR